MQDLCFKIHHIINGDVMLQGICEFAQQRGKEWLGASLLSEHRGQRFRARVIIGGGRDIGDPGGVFRRQQREQDCLTGVEVAEHIRLGQANLAGNRIERKVGNPRGGQHAARCV